MKQLILYPSSIAQWQALVQDAESLASVNLTEDIQSYLVFLLMRFVNRPEVAQSVMAFEFLNSITQVGTQRLGGLKEMGDKCLLFSGLFPGRARKRRLRISYFINLGQSAYALLAEQRDKKMAHLFFELSHHFVALMDILHSMREIEAEYTSLDPLQAEELWADTRSVHALKHLQHIAHGHLLGSSPLSHARH